jgi:hypothetical protein
MPVQTANTAHHRPSNSNGQKRTRYYSNCQHERETPPRHTPTAVDTAAISSSGPYLCDLIPETALRQITGFSGELLTGWDGPQTDNGLCLVRSPGVQPSPLGLDWSYHEGRRILQEQRYNYQIDLLKPLPQDLGDGFAASGGTDSITGRPNHVIALFRCGTREPWLGIELRQVSHGRDAIKDLTQLMRIAEHRFGKLHHCTPMPT